MTEFITQTVAYYKPGSTERFSIEVSAEPTACPHLVITPGLVGGDDGTPHLVGWLSLTHTGTGVRVANGDADGRRLHTLAEQLAKFDWDFTDPNHMLKHHSVRDAVVEVIQDWRMSDAYDGPVSLWGDDDEKKAAREREPATTLLVEQLDWWIEHAKSYMDGLDWDNDDHNRIRAAHIATSVEGYGAIYLLAVLRTLNPKVADIAARDLVAALDAGDVLGEWVWQWRDELAKGRPLTLRGIPAHDPLDGFKA